VNGRTSQLSVRGQARPALGKPLCFRQTAGSYETARLEVAGGELMSAVEWYTADPDLGGRVLHTLTVPAVLARRVGLERVPSFDALWDALDAGDRPVRHLAKRDYPTENDRVAVAIGLPAGTSLWYESQFLQDGERRSMAVEVTYSRWQKVTYS